MRSWWPISPTLLDNKRLLGEHNELLIMGRTIAGLSSGWKNHPEVKRWRGHLRALRCRHDEIATEILRRGMNHRSPWPENLVSLEPEAESFWPTVLWEPIEVMLEKLRLKTGVEISFKNNP